ncbi:hypothetical protein DM02DRAFT_388337 [Periconia macrospinosa]|uniref:Uncharacterized protein n=1 Tax=Periconia macrospinosa TaxID=97972 RepID=A0A2V1DRA8_9PLEO|nr:hypothetical protein DM02DRAFT_388337 [Periconia macrospinosa]
MDRHGLGLYGRLTLGKNQGSGSLCGCPFLHQTFPFLPYFSSGGRKGKEGGGSLSSSQRYHPGKKRAWRKRMGTEMMDIHVEHIWEKYVFPHSPLLHHFPPFFHLFLTSCLFFLSRPTHRTAPHHTNHLFFFSFSFLLPLSRLLRLSTFISVFVVISFPFHFLLSSIFRFLLALRILCRVCSV